MGYWSNSPGHRKQRVQWRQCVTFAALGGFLFLASCSGDDEYRADALAEGYSGGVAGDEPRAVTIARGILGDGGNAADAAAALYFAMTVTYPTSVGVGAGGACLVYDALEGRAYALEFPAIAPKRINPAASRRSAVPGAVRGMFVLQARYGRMPWGRVVSPAEQLARIGHPISRALARDLALARGSLFADPGIASVFARADGGPLREGDTLIQSDLADALERIRVRGADALYGGELGLRFVAAVNQAGGSLEIEDLRNYRPTWRGTARLRSGAREIHTMPPPTAGGVALLKMWQLLRADKRYDKAEPDERGHLLAEVSLRAFADGSTGLSPTSDENDDFELATKGEAERLLNGYSADRHVPPDSPSPRPAEGRGNVAGSSFVVVDGEGNAVACAISLNGLFGVGRIAPGTGIVLAAAPPPLRQPTASLVPVLITLHESNQLVFAGAASGGMAVPLALVEVIAGTLLDGSSLSQAVATPRLHHVGVPDMVVHEPDEDRPRLDGLSRRVYTVAEVPELGRVNAAYCPDGFERAATSCSFITDRRGYGLARVAQF
jgi:gamma-glutamyltranspeptidase/glutathione hydrolase